MDSVYGMLGAVWGCAWQLRPLGGCWEANLVFVEPACLHGAAEWCLSDSLEDI